MMNDVWSSGKTQMSVDTVRSLLTIKVNAGLTSSQFADAIEREESLLKAIHSSTKYQAQ